MDGVIFALVVVAAIAAFVQSVRKVKRESAELKNEKAQKPWEGERPELLNTEQRKRLGLEPTRHSKSAKRADRAAQMAAVPAAKSAAVVVAATPAPPSPTVDRFAHLHPEPVTPRVVEFVYENSDGEVSVRTVTVDQVGTSHFAGQCRKEGAERTFRFDRLIGPATLEDSGELVQSDALRDLLRGYDEHELRRRNRAAAKSCLEILFTGFKKDRKAELEELARDSGMIVRTRVTENLDFLCGGYNTGPTKLAEAQAKGVTVVDEAQFLRLLETGEVPA